MQRLRNIFNINSIFYILNGSRKQIGLIYFFSIFDINSTLNIFFSTFRILHFTFQTAQEEYRSIIFFKNTLLSE